MAREGSNIITFKEAGVLLPPDEQLYLLPLLQPKKKGKAPLDRLPQGAAAASSKRIAFTTQDDSGRSIDWTASTHVFPSAYPRSHYASTAPPSSCPPEVDVNRAKQDRTAERESRKVDLELWSEMSQTYSVESFYPPSSEEEAQRLAENLLDGRQPQLWSCIERLVPSKPVNDGITLFLAHANGFHKEIYEPVTQDLINNLTKQGKGSPQISEVWSIDTFNSGDSAALNRGNLGQATSWFDHPRDMLQFLDFYLPELYADDLPTLLEAHSKGTTRNSRCMVGIAHSFSGAGMLMLNSIHSDYFEGLIIIDPVGHPLHSLSREPVPKVNILAQGAVARKDVFPNRKAAADYLNTKPFFQAWDPRVVDVHVKYGFRAVHDYEKEKDPPVTLCMSKWSEALAFSTSFIGAFGNASVKRSKFKGWAHLICTGDGAASFIFGPEGEDSKELQENFEKYFSTTGRATSEVAPGGHLIVQEQPQKMGARIAQLITRYSKAKQPASRSRL